MLPHLPHAGAPICSAQIQLLQSLPSLKNQSGSSSFHRDGVSISMPSCILSLLHLSRWSSAPI